MNRSYDAIFIPLIQLGAPQQKHLLTESGDRRTFMRGNPIAAQATKIA
jgi:hypothetical protein